MYIFVHIHLYTYIHIHMYFYTYLYICLYICVCVCVCIYTNLNLLVFTSYIYVPLFNDDSIFKPYIYLKFHPPMISTHATHCYTPQHAATRCNTLQHILYDYTCTKFHFPVIFHFLISTNATHCNTLQHTATHCNTLQHTATHCNTLQHILITFFHLFFQSISLLYNMFEPYEIIHAITHTHTHT